MDRSFDVPGVTARQLAVLLARSVEVWGVVGGARAESGVFPVRLELHDGQRFAIEPAGAAEEPIRWWLLWLSGQEGAATATATAAGDAGDAQARAGRSLEARGLAASMDADGATASTEGEARPSTVVRRKPCASVAGLLRTLRETLGVTGQSRIRVGVSDA